MNRLIVIFVLLLAVGFSLEAQNEALDKQFLEMENDDLLVKLDLTRGGAIAYISKSGQIRNLVNVYDEGLEVLLQAEAEERTHRRFERLKKSARFRYQATVEELNLEASRGINKDQITALATGSYLEKGE